VGVGLGDYQLLAEKIGGQGNVAHSTYLQGVAEWGIFVGVSLSPVCGGLS